jgi:predicted RNase H-like HicB family nuclease
MNKEVTNMRKFFTLEYWIDEDWYVGRLKEVPGVFSQGASLQELEKNIRDAYKSMIEDDVLSYKGIQSKEIEVAV